MNVGSLITLDEYNAIILDTYRALNNITPALSLNVTTAQFYRVIEDQGGSPYRMQFPSKHGKQYFDNDDDGLLTTDITRDIISALE